MLFRSSRLLNDSYFTTPSGIRDPKNPIINASAGSGVTGIGPTQGFIGGAVGLAGGLTQVTSTNTRFNLSKKELTDAVSRKTRKHVSIHTLDSDGKKYDSIRLVGAMITSVSPTALKYSSGDLNKIEITLTFDYADYGREGVYNYGGLINKFQSNFPTLANKLRPEIK